MIVRDEAAIIQRCLASVAPYIAHWVILDTGSRDRTPELVEAFFLDANIPGELQRSEFRNFGATRNEALAVCRASPAAFDYVLFIDADMELVVEDPAWRERLSEPCYSLRQTNTLVYENVRLVRRDVEARYVGVTHEYLETGSAPVRLNGVYMIDHACGSNRENKSERDIILLRRGLEQEPDNLRYLFYLAQSLYDAGHFEAALEHYRKRADAGGWDEEAWYARYRAALCLRELGEADAFVAAALSCWDQRPWRAEPLAELARYYRESGRNQLACELAATGLRLPFPDRDRLFIEKDVYHWRFAEELSISGYYAVDAAHRQLGQSLCNRLATASGAPASMRNLARGNVAFYARQAQEWLGLKMLDAVAPRAPDGPCLNPSVWWSGDDRAAIVRQCNYRIVDGRYVIDDVDDVIRTRNYLARLTGSLEISEWLEIRMDEDRMEVAPAPRFDFPVRGYEDCRLIRWRGAWWASATVRDTTPEGRCEMALLRLADDGSVREEILLRGDWSSRHQKNWMPFLRGDELMFVYSLDPTVILRFDQRRRIAEHYHTSGPAEALDHLRGGSQLVWTSGGWLGLCHEAALPAGGPRTYLHRFFMLNERFCLCGLSEPFSFTGEPIEFCAGLALLEDEQILAVSFGVNDAQAFFATVELDRALSTLRQGF